MEFKKAKEVKAKIVTLTSLVLSFIFLRLSVRGQDR